MAPIRKSEEEVGRIWDRCFVDTTIKAASGAIVGSLFSLLFFKRKSWPVALGLGVGIGAGYTNCRHQFWWRRYYPYPPAQGFKYRPPFWRAPPHSRKDNAPEKSKEAPPPADVAPEPVATEKTEIKPSDS
ncbi:uncharacterized protein LOC116301759 [Actinia tenebrosa]|uniref:MICOS complex subunit MIC10 n=1 Tax=Actinia tenebrosa TaxID=6105 RepID=A0A6P8IIQ1_ACTTE|nr:uncharacterized protein LOC116301759 [Actinia tenebrosa]